MKIYTVEITVVNGISAKAIFERDDFKSALSACYSVLSSALANPNCTEALCMIINSDGGVYKTEHWKAEENTIIDE